jgi:hypothetical protein
MTSLTAIATRAPGAPTDLAAEGAAARPQAAAALASDGADQAGAAAQTAASPAASLIRDAVARQGGLATLFADLEAIVSAPNPQAPQAVVTQAKALLTMRLDAGSGNAITADGIAAAIAQSGVAIGGASVSQPNLGTALAALRQTLTAWLDSEPAATSSTQEAAPPTASRATVPMPPFRGAPTVAQAPAAATIAPGASPHALALHLLRETDAALARHMLLQIASHPGTASHGENHHSGVRLVSDIPLATAQGTAVVQIGIEPDSHKSTQASGKAPVWRASFSVDLEPIGPVHVRIALSGERVSVTMNAERAGSAQHLADGLPLLESTLREAALEPAELRCQTGVAPTPAAAPGLFVDHAT